MTPEIVQAYNEATNLLNKNKYDKAMSAFKKIAGKASFKELWVNLGNCYRFKDMDTKALDCYKRANDPSIPYINGSMDSQYNLALNNLGLLQFCEGRDDSAIAYYDTAINRDTNFYDARWNKATAVLRKACSGHPELFELGWSLYEDRFKKSPPVNLKNDKENLQIWNGEYVDSLIILAEQGIGDNIMWSRYIPEIKKRCGKLWVQCDDSLKVIFDGENTTFHASATDATHGVPMCSLSRFVPGIPPAGWNPSPLLKEKYEFPKDRPNIGIVYSGSPTHANNRNRSVTVNRFHRFAPYANLYCLSPGFTSTKYVKGLDVKSWQDTIRYLNGLDLVIAVDTSVVHMAGLLGVETWMLQPLKETDFRWGSHASESNVWYDSVKIIRNPKSWDHVFTSVEDRLKERFYL